MPLLEPALVFNHFLQQHSTLPHIVIFAADCRQGLLQQSLLRPREPFTARALLTTYLAMPPRTGRQLVAALQILLLPPNWLLHSGCAMLQYAAFPNL